MEKYEKKKIDIISNIIIFSGIILLCLILTFFIYNNFRLYNLILKYKIELIFLIISGIFINSFNYKILLTNINCNILIIYISNFILKKEPFLGIEVVLFFIVSLLIVNTFINIIVNQKVIIEIYSSFSKLLIWSFLLFLVNLSLYLLKINYNNEGFIELLLIPIIILLHILTNNIIYFIYLKVKNKIINFYYRFVPSIIVDSILITFSIVLGNIYLKAGIINISIIIALLVIIIILVTQIIDYYSRKNIILSLMPFLYKNKNIYNIYIEGNSFSIIENINKLLFILVKLPDKKYINVLNRLHFISIKNYYFNVFNINDKPKDLISIINKYSDNSASIIYTIIDKNNLLVSDINYIIYTLINKKMEGTVYEILQKDLL